MIPGHIKEYFKKHCEQLTFKEKVNVYNEATDLLKEMLGLDHPVFATKLVQASHIQANTYNPNRVAPPEMKLLQLSMEKDGITMPLVAAKNNKGTYIIVDGFHRAELIKYVPALAESLNGYVPVVELNKEITDRITSTVRHNMARGSHKTGLTARLVGLLKNHNWSDEKIGKELGMDSDEVLRLKQMTGLAEAFSNEEFSQSWE